jgi:hypothetical protein
MQCYLFRFEVATPVEDQMPRVKLTKKHCPGEYETVKRLLGHRNIQTTINFYCGLETTQANEAFGKIIRDHIKFTEDA